jgi:hypothetical protein
MEGIDLKDKKLEPYLYETERELTWYIKVLKRMLNISAHNAHTVYNISQEKINHMKFRHDLVKPLI